MATLLGGLLLTACSSGDEFVETEKEWPVVNVQLSFSLPQRIVDTRPEATRMTGDVVQLGEDSWSFRGLRDIRLFCFDGYPTKTARRIGSAIEINTDDAETTTNTTDYSIYSKVGIPVGTTHFGFYARANDLATTHAQRSHYGALETIGLKSSEYTDNSGITFRPVQLCPTDDALGGSTRGQALIDLLNDLMATTATATAPNDKWATSNVDILAQTYQMMTALTTASSFNIQTMLGKVYRLLLQVKDGEDGYAIATAVANKIKANCQTIDALQPDHITLLDKYQGFPADVHLPSGAARIVWQSAAGEYGFPTGRNYGNGFNIPLPSDYVYPINLQYQIFSDIVTSDSLILVDHRPETTTGGNQTGGNVPTSDTQPGYSSWTHFLDSVYDGSSRVVEYTTRSVSMRQQAQYAVGRLAARVKLETDVLYDAKGMAYDATNGFTLVGYIIGGQHEVDYNFYPVEGSREYAIYDTDLNSGNHLVKKGAWTAYNYTLGLATPSDTNVSIALELINNGADFEGADGTIVHGATFYLVANMNPKTGSNYSTGILDQIFLKDFATRADITILRGWPDTNGDGIPDPELDDEHQPKPLTGLATATYGLPAPSFVPPSVGMSVDFSWNKGLEFEDVIL